MPISYFRRMAAQSFRHARTSLQPQIDYETLMRLGRAFKVRATAARTRLASMQGVARDVAARRREAERRENYGDRRE
jgi:hypothetical protein